MTKQAKREDMPNELDVYSVSDQQKMAARRTIASRAEVHAGDVLADQVAWTREIMKYLGLDKSQADETEYLLTTALTPPIDSALER